MVDDLTKTMHQGCFTPAAFGLYEESQGVVIFNGTDEAEQIRFNANIAALSVLPYSATVARFGGPSSINPGTYMYLYDNFPTNLTQVSTLVPFKQYKQLTGNPDAVINNSAGQPLVVNSSALAYAPRGQWMVTESPHHALVRVNLATMSLLSFAPSFYTSGAPYATHEAALAITEDGRYAAVASSEFGHFKIYDLNSCSGGDPTDDLVSKNCGTYDYWNYVSNEVSGALSRISNVHFVTDELIAFDATTPVGTASYILSPTGSVNSLTPYLGMGDSYASGQGAWDYAPGTDTSVNKCHLSVHAYPQLLSGDIFSSTGHSVACSGARITDIENLSGGYHGQASDGKVMASRESDGSASAILHDFTPGYLAQESFVAAYLPGVITIQIGGNDIGFGAMLLKCVSPLAKLWPPALNSSDCYSSYEDRLEVAQTIDRKYPQWVQLYKELRRVSPESRIYAIGYPQIAATSGDCSFNARLSSGDINFARMTVAYLNTVIKQAAMATGVQYIDISDALVGHQLCSDSTEVAVNGVTAGSDALHILGQESFHPNALGHRLIEQTILQKTHNFALPNTTPASQIPPAVDAGNPILQAPVSGRQVRPIVPDDSITTPVAQPGDSITITISGMADGLQPNTGYSISIDNTVLGTQASDSQGNLQGSATIPINTPGGLHDIVINGTGASGTPVTITTVIYTHTSDSTTPDSLPVEIPGVVESEVTLQSTAKASQETIFSAILANNKVVILAKQPALSTNNAQHITNVGQQTKTQPKPELAHFAWYIWLGVEMGSALTGYCCWRYIRA